MNYPPPAEQRVAQESFAGIITMTCGLVGLTRAARADPVRFTYSSSRTCAYDHTTELLDFFAVPALPCVPCPRDACFHKPDRSAPYKLVCLVTANAGHSTSYFEAIYRGIDRPSGSNGEISNAKGSGAAVILSAQCNLVLLRRLYAGSKTTVCDP
jgi:hypothetical protein